MGRIVRGRIVLIGDNSSVPENHLKTLGDRIRLLRKERGLTQEMLADVAKLDRSYIGGVERGERNLTFTVLCQICNALRCDVATLTHGLPRLPS